MEETEVGDPMIPKQNIKKSLLAGVLISIGALFSIAAKPYGNVVQGLCFSVGLFGVLSCGALLFTGQVLSIQAAWDGKISTKDLLVRWSSVWVLNLVGSVCMAAMAYAVHFDASQAAQLKASLPWHELVIRAILCNVLVCLAVWMNRFFAEDAIENFIAALLPVACFVACGFEHSVADMLYMPLGMMQGAVGLTDCVRVILLATVGNVLGGMAFSWMVHER